MSRHFLIICLIAVFGLSLWLFAVPSQTDLVGILILVGCLWISLGSTYIRFHKSYYRTKPDYRQAFNSVYMLILVGTIYGVLLHLTNGQAEIAILLMFLVIGVCFIVPWLIRFLVQRKNYTLTHQILDVLQTAIPANPYIYMTRANIYHAQSQFEQATFFASHAIEVLSNPKKKGTDPVTIPDTALIQAYQIRFNASLASEDGPMAVSDAEILVQAYPNNPTAYLNRAFALMKDNDLAAAASDLEHASHMILTPSDQAALENSLGYLAYAQGDYDTAYTKYRNALKVELFSTDHAGFHAVIHNNLGFLALAEGRSDLARTSFQSAQKLSPHSGIEIEGLALFYAQREEWHKAVELWRGLMTQHPFFKDPEEVIRRHHRWTPPMADLVRQIAAKANP